MKKALTTRNLSKRVFASELPEKFARELPAQALYLAIRENGLSSSLDLIEIASLDQCRLIMDFDCWDGDSFSEEQFWEWLSLDDEDSGFPHLEKLIKFVDLRLITILIAKYVEVVTFDEGNDEPPAPGFHTPDKGFTWLRVHSLDADKIFLLNRFLALIFERWTEVFYQLISIPAVSTVSLLEEESYVDRNKRLAAEGVPDSTHAHELTSPIPPYKLEKELASSGRRQVIEDVKPVEPLVYNSSLVQPLGSLLSFNIEPVEFERELTLLMNGAIVRWNVPFHEIEIVKELADKVKGAINMGIEQCLEISSLSVLDIYQVLGLQKLFRAGLFHLFELRKMAHRIPVDMLHPDALGPEKFAIVAGARDDFSVMPSFMERDGSFQLEDGVVPTDTKAIEHLDEVRAIRAHLEETFNN